MSNRTDTTMKLTADEGMEAVGCAESTEAQLREDLAAAYRLTHMLGMDYLIYNHITVRIPGPEKHFLINAFGLSYDEITASNLLKIRSCARFTLCDAHPPRGRNGDRGDGHGIITDKSGCTDFL
jgi:hypothetical protein